MMTQDQHQASSSPSQTEVPERNSLLFFCGGSGLKHFFPSLCDAIFASPISSTSSPNASVSTPTTLKWDQVQLVVPVTDDGGSSRALRDAFGGPAVGDARNVALSLASALREALSKRHLSTPETQQQQQHNVDDNANHCNSFSLGKCMEELHAFLAQRMDPADGHAAATALRTSVWSTLVGPLTDTLLATLPSEVAVDLWRTLTLALLSFFLEWSLRERSLYNERRGNHDDHHQKQEGAEKGEDGQASEESAFCARNASVGNLALFGFLLFVLRRAQWTREREGGLSSASRGPAYRERYLEALREISQSLEDGEICGHLRCTVEELLDTTEHFLVSSVTETTIKQGPLTVAISWFFQTACGAQYLCHVLHQCGRQQQERERDVSPCCTSVPLFSVVPHLDLSAAAVDSCFSREEGVENSEHVSGPRSDGNGASAEKFCLLRPMRKLPVVDLVAEFSLAKSADLPPQEEVEAINTNIGTVVPPPLPAVRRVQGQRLISYPCNETHGDCLVTVKHDFQQRQTNGLPENNNSEKPKETPKTSPTTRMEAVHWPPYVCTALHWVATDIAASNHVALVCNALYDPVSNLLASYHVATTPVPHPSRTRVVFARGSVLSSTLASAIPSFPLFSNLYRLHNTRQKVEDGEKPYSNKQGGGVDLVVMLNGWPDYESQQFAAAYDGDVPTAYAAFLEKVVGVPQDGVVTWLTPPGRSADVGEADTPENNYPKEYDEALLASVLLGPLSSDMT